MLYFAGFHDTTPSPKKLGAVRSRGKALLAPWWVFVAGAAGWWLAFILRVPVILASKVSMSTVSKGENLLRELSTEIKIDRNRKTPC
jgi:hypothetical protein